VTLEHNLSVRLANPAASEMLGLPRDALEGCELSNWGKAGLEPLHAGLQQFTQIIARHFQASPTQAWSEQLELATPSSNRMMLVRGRPLSESDTPDYVLVLDDVTQLIRAQRDAAWGEAARRMAHEIKNPLTPIQLSAERLEAKLYDRLEGAARDTLTRAVATIVGQVTALKGLVDAFAQYARLPSPRIEKVDLNGLVQEMLDLYQDSIPIETNLEPQLPPVAGDPSLLRQVLVNLVKNAQEAQDDTPNPLIRIRTRIEDLNLQTKEQSGQRILLCVEDNGAGFPEAHKSRMFEPYATTKPKGTGLGMAVVKKIVEEHHGEIDVCNIEGGGARISVWLPALTKETARAR
jgi:nitrogen fixation/metabolism regulation signal transduction histidine kinase